MLGLADQVGGHVARVGGQVGEDGDLGGPGLGVDADPALEQPLGRDHVDVARPGDHVHRAAAGLAGTRAVGEHRDRLGAADRVDLLHAEQRARGQHGRVRQAAEVPLRRRGDRDPGHAGDLRRNHVHHHGRGIDRQAARHVEPDPVHRHPALGDHAAGHHDRLHVAPLLVGVHLAHPPDRLLECGPHLWVERGQRLADGLRGNPQRAQPHAVEALAVFDQRRLAAMAYVLADRADGLDGRLDVELGARHQATHVHARRTQVHSTQIDTVDHTSSVVAPAGRLARDSISRARQALGLGLCRRRCPSSLSGQCSSPGW